MNRRTLIGVAAASATLLLNRVVGAQTSPKTRNVVFVHGLFADGSCWSKVIARLQREGVNCTSVQNPLTSLQEASEAARRAIAAQPGPTVLVGHSFSGMIVTEVGVERFMARRMGAKTIEIEASHLALISHPDAIANLILEALAV